ncbi:MAG: hypothetical protein ACK514_10975 [Bacteroidota bacterium]|jgi:hypothetical protein|nr:hypothetical protein [Cytophagales bacterium]MCE2956788.1 hypothetical protein [Flammeovirgaceae bacterium]MCZ8069155.1 hypothetical protein [Cytophagales bacterium]
MSLPLPIVRTFQVTKWKVVKNSFWILGCLSVGTFLIYLIATNADGLGTWLSLLLAFFVASLFGFTAVYLFVELTSKLTIHTSEIQFNTIRSSRTIAFSDMAGYRIFDSGDSDDIGDTICIEQKNKNQLVLPVALTNKEVLVEWLRANFIDLNAAEYAKDKTELLSDQKLGENVIVRQKNLERVKKVFIWLTIVAILCPLALQFANPYNSMAFISIAIVPITFILVSRYKGIVHYSYHPNSDRPTAFFVLFLSTLLLCMYALFNYNYLEHVRLWIPVIVVALLLWVVLLATTNEFNKRSSNDMATAFIFLVLMILYSWSTYRITNCALDTDPGKTLTSQVVSKRISEGDGSDNYYVSIKPVSPLEDLEIAVEKEVYFELNDGDAVKIIVKNGRWGTPWCYVDINQ